MMSPNIMYDTNLPLKREFYSRDTVTVAQELLGTILVRKINNHKIITGIISETEAYGHTNDPASHAYKNKTQRNHIMFEKVGMSYVYFTYGMHYCFNVTARDPSVMGAGAVLIRGIIPQKGIPTIMKNRGTVNTKILTNGPAKLTQALGISSKQYGVDLTLKGNLYITNNVDYENIRGKRNKNIIKSPRVGIRDATDKLWNFKLCANI